jgi:DNA-binding winged helix-turn-helix (wHTH) protein
LELRRFYCFGPFCLDSLNRNLLRDGERLPLQPKAYKVLFMLIENAGRTVRREELIDAIWGLNVTEGALNYQINQLRRVLGETSSDPQYIETFPKVGFRFIANVTAVNEIQEPTRASRVAQHTEVKEDNNQRRRKADHQIASFLDLLTRTKSSVAGHAWFILIASGIYASYFGVALLVETAYHFDRYSPVVFFVALLIFCMVFLSSILGLLVGAKRTLSGKPAGLLLSVAVFVLAAAAVLVVASWFLPAEPITQANFQTFTARAAYIKDLCYIVPLGLIFLVAPFNFVIGLERDVRDTNGFLSVNLLTGVKPSTSPPGTIFLRIWFLMLLLAGMMVYSLIARAHLFDNLKPGPYMGLFQTLIHVRMSLYFGLAILCLVWYYHSLEALKRECLTRGEASRGAAASQLS